MKVLHILKEQSKAAKPLMKRLHKTYALSDQPADPFFAPLIQHQEKVNFALKKSLKK